VNDTTPVKERSVHQKSDSVYSQLRINQISSVGFNRH